MIDNKCKICRRVGVKLFLKGEKCLSPKCPLIKKAYPPGQRGKRRRRALSEYGKELAEKQKMKNWYNLAERQFQKYVKETLASRRKVEDTATLLIQTLEKRLDNVVFRLGFASSRSAACQLVSHRHIQVNNRTVNISSFSVKKGDLVKVKESSLSKKLFQTIKTTIKKHTPPTWLSLDPEKLEGKVIGEPNLEEAAPPAEISSVFEFYSR